MSRFMERLARLGTLRTAIVVLTAITALYYSLVAIGNITDWSSNFDFVDHVFAMDTTFQDKDLMKRRITNDTMVKAAYVGVIIWEVLIALTLITALIYWLRGRDHMGRRFSTLAWTMGMVLFGGLFIVIGGEWFAMWQSQTWNGLDPAFRNFTIAGIGLILANMWSRDREALVAETEDTARHRAHNLNTQEQRYGEDLS
jgi:predicted small integral membrane protein